MPRLDKYLPGNEEMLEAETDAALAAGNERFADAQVVKIETLPLEPREGWCLSGPLHGKELAAKSDSVHLATETAGKITVFEYKFVHVCGTGLWVPSEWEDEKWSKALLKQAFEI